MAALTTVDRLKDFLEISSLTATQEATMSSIIDMISDYIESYCGRTFQKTEYSNELCDGPFDERLVLNNYPVISGETFTFQNRNSSSNSDEWETIESTEYFIKHSEGEIFSTGRSKFILAVDRYRVTYTAGYDYDLVAAFPSDVGIGDLELAVWLLGGEIWNKRKGSMDVKGERLGDYSITYSGSGSINSLIKNPQAGSSISMVQSTLDKYRDYRVDSVITPDNSEGTLGVEDRGLWE